MNILRRQLGWILVVMTLTGPAALAQTEQRLAIIDEKLDKLRAEVEALQFKQQQFDKQMVDLQAQINQLRKTEGGVTAADLQALDDRVKALDTARQKDKEVILSTLSKELASIASGRSTVAAPVGDGKEHVVQKGENLSVIAKACGVSVADLKKANNLTTDEIKVGQKLLIPK